MKDMRDTKFTSWDMVIGHWPYIAIPEADAAALARDF
jgi:hypothetical protein